MYFLVARATRRATIILKPFRTFARVYGT